MTSVLWTLHCLDGPGAAGRRDELRPAHSARLGTADPAPLLYGPLLADDGVTQLGSLFLIEAPDRATVRRWVDEDPFTAGGVWQEVRIHALRLSDRSPVRIPTPAGPPQTP
ncbi:YciI family protein [Kitasatospora camelliae]|uniref:YciI family protein n=1 Tax=Kitasatospora camelliae TaxID=3156397 RepID=A0AAU8JZW3_9ACTN